MSFTLLKHQIIPAQEILRAIKDKKSIIVSAPAGSGKTFPVANALRLATEQGYLPSQTSKVASKLYLGPKASLIQQQRVLAREGVKNVLVSSYSGMRSSFGEIFIDWIPSAKRTSELDYEPVWNNLEIPDILVADECQAVKNGSSQQGEVVGSYSRQGGQIIFISFTPFQKVIEAKVVCIACKLCTESTWLSFANDMAGWAELTANSPAATKRIKEALEAKGCWITFHNVYWKHKARIKTRLINFSCQEHAETYARAYEEYLEKLAALGRYGPAGIAEIFVAMLKFWQCAEILKSEQLATYGRLIKERENKQVIIASNFVDSLRAIWSKLTKQGVDPNQIGFLVGGQSDSKRQGFIDRFQQGDLDYLLLTLKTGGTSLSLHHELESARPRHVILPLTWSVFDMVQVLGRAHRINSLSDTEQDIIGYDGTIEGNKILPRLDSKLKCIRELLEKKDSLILDILNEMASKEVNEMLIEKTTDGADEEDDSSSFDSDMIEDGNEDSPKLITL
jgi:hypothetical protein